MQNSSHITRSQFGIIFLRAALGTLLGAAVPLSIQSVALFESPDHFSLNRTIQENRWRVGCAACVAAYAAWRVFPYLCSSFEHPILDIPKATPEKNHAVIICHGFGDCAESWRRQKDQFTDDVQPIFVDMIDTTQPGSHRFRWWQIRFFNFGQSWDAHYIRSALVQAYKRGYTTLSLLGHSRGGAAALEVIKSLEDNDLHAWQRAGATKAMVPRLREALHRGNHCLERPLLSLPDALRHQFGVNLGSLALWALWLFADYSPFKKTGIEIFESCALDHYNFLIHLTSDDDMIGNSTDVRLIPCLQKNSNSRLIYSSDTHKHVIRDLKKEYALWKK